MARVLVADDERSICDAFCLLLEAEGHTPLVASTGEEALRTVRDARPDLVFVDVRMPGMDGLAVLKAIQESSPGLPVVVMTAFGTLDTAAQAVRNKAFDYLGKPLDLAQIRQVLRRALHKPETGSATSVMPAQGADDTRPALVGQSPAMQQIFKQIVRLADNDLTVLVQGESGVGKELVARAIHDSGSRAQTPFVAVNCAAIPEQLIESELFGHERGAFTDAKSARVGRFEAAGTGTLFLDEISELPLHLQGKLLRVLQERSFERVGSLTPLPFQARLICASNRALDVAVQAGDFRARLICASNRALDVAVQAGDFREDLFHRVNIVTLTVPPLRDRREDIPELVHALIRRASRETGKTIESVEREVLDRLRSQPWSGNVRELEHVIKRSMLRAHGSVLTVHDLSLGQDPAPGPAASDTEIGRLLESLTALAAALVAAAGRSEETPPLHELSIGRLEAALIEAALAATGGNQVGAARLLGMSRSTLRGKLPE